jgi:ribose transport system substrate-binding protein
MQRLDRRFSMKLIVGVFAALAVCIVFSTAGRPRTEPGEARPASLAGSAPGAAPHGEFSPDLESDAVSYADLVARAGETRRRRTKHRLGAVVKFFGNEYWDLVARGMSEKSADLGIFLDIQAGSNALDPEGQLSVVAGMFRKGYAMLLVSPQTGGNLEKLVADERQAGCKILNVQDGVLKNADYWVGPNQFDTGSLAARHLLELLPHGGKVAVIKGPSGVYSVERRTQGFVGTLEGTPFRVVAQVNCDWDLQTALDQATAILKEHPDLKGFYCNSDIMALGAARAVKMAGKKGAVAVIGSGGITHALESVRTGEMTATVSTFPRETGRIAVDVAVRILDGQAVPRVVRTPQMLITQSNVHDWLSPP